MVWLSTSPVGCAHYGWRDRADPARPRTPPAHVAVATVAAPSWRGADTRRATLSLIRGLERCGVTHVRWGSPVEASSPFVDCVAQRLTTDTVGRGIFVEVEVTCTLRGGDGGPTTTLTRRGRAAIAAPASDLRDRVLRERRAHTDALLGALDEASCPIVDALATHSSPTPESTAADGEKVPQ